MSRQCAYLWVVQMRQATQGCNKPSSTCTRHPSSLQAVGRLAHQGKEGWQLAGCASRQLSERRPDITERARYLPQRLGRRNKGRCQCWALHNYRALLQAKDTQHPVSPGMACSAAPSSSSHKALSPQVLQGPAQALRLRSSPDARWALHPRCQMSRLTGKLGPCTGAARAALDSGCCWSGCFCRGTRAPQV